MPITTKVFSSTQHAEDVKVLQGDIRKLLAATVRASKKHEIEMLKLIDERDIAEQTISQAYYLVIGRSPEWSNRFGHDQALEEIGDAVNILRKVARKSTLETAP